MDILDESFGVQTESVPLEDLIEVRPLESNIPTSAIRNRAATDALLTSPPEKMVDDYRLYMKEGEEGNDTSHEGVLRKTEDANRNKSMKHVLNILGDKSVPLEEKQKYFNIVQREGFKEEPAMTLRTNALTAPSEGESVRAEVARVSTATMMKNIQADAEKRQKMVNSVLATLPDASARTVGELAEAEVMPFGRNVIAANINEAIKKTAGEDIGFVSWVSDFLTPGTTKRNIQEKLSRIPLEKRDEFAHNILEGIKQSKAIFYNDNYYAQYQNAVKLLQGPIASKEEAWAENMFTVFDAFWVGSEIAAIGKVAAPTGKAAGARRPGSKQQTTDDVPFEEVHKADWELVEPPKPFHNPMQIGKPKAKIAGPAKEADDVKRIQMNSVVRQENPVAPFSVIEQSNPAKARSIHKAVVEAQSDELAEAVAGVSREQFIINNTVPQIATESGSVLAKVNQAITDVIENTSAIRYTPEELAQAQTNIEKSFRSVEGMQINDSMTSFRLDGDRIIADAHYTAPGGSFDTAKEAREHIKFFAREMGIRDDEIEILKREGLDYIPHVGDDAIEGDFIVRVKTAQEITDDAVGNWSSLDVRRNFFDRVGFLVTDGGGSISRWLADASSMLHPTITSAASTAVDQTIVLENILLKPIKELRSEIEAMDKVRRSKIEEYIKEANLKQIKYDPVNLTAQGFNPEEIDALRKWKDIQDGHYYLENFDLIRTLRSQGYNILDNGNTTLFAKPLKDRNYAKGQNIGKVYDPSSGTIRSLSDAEFDALYAGGGHYAKLRRPTDFNGVTAEYVMVRNTPTEYLRALRDTDKVLNYVDGYYTIYYKAPRFVEMKYVDPVTKQEGWRAVAVAGSTEEANIYKANALSNNPMDKYRVRGDVRAVRHEDDAYWDLNSSRGRIAQRVRGATLEDASGLQHLGDGKYMVHPMESAVRASKSLADRTMTRKMIETAKNRAIKQYGEMFPPDGMGGKRFPNSVKEISDSGNPFGKGYGDSPIGDARTTVEYIRYLENGYINTTDELYKAGMNILANWLGAKQLTIAEKIAYKLGEVAPTHVAKTSVFQAYIGLNPLRQIILQPHQSIRMAAYNPKGYLKAFKLVGDFSVYKAMELTGRTPLHLPDFVKFIDDSGMLAGVDQNSLVRGMKLDLAASSNKAKRILGQVASTPQVVGFNTGEKANQLLHLANVYESHTSKGVNLKDKNLRDKAYAEARALSYEMNSAGDMPYTQNALAAQFQFLQVPHKAFLQFTNRKLNNKDLMRLAAFDTLMWGTPIAGLAAWAGMGLLPDNKPLREILTEGLEVVGLNAFFSLISGEETKSAYSGLDPYGLDGWLKMWDALTEDGAYAMLQASPAGQLWGKEGGRIPNALNMMARWLRFSDGEGLPPPSATDAWKAVAEISSGWNNFNKGLILLAARKKFDSQGNTVVGDVTTSEALHQMFGMAPDAEVKLYEASKAVDKLSKAHREDVMRRYRDILRWTHAEMSNEKPNLERIQMVTTALMESFKDDPVGMQMVQRKWQEDMQGKERALAIKLIKATGLPDVENLKDIIRQSPVPQEQKDQAMQRVDDFATIRQKMKEQE